MEESTVDLQNFYPDCLRIKKITEDTNQITIMLKSLKRSHCCLKCGHEAQTYHATYMRTVQDLPIFQKNVKLHIMAYDYYCGNESCEVVWFAEDYDGFVGKSERMTNRVENFIRTLAQETNCEGASAICKERGIRVSGDTIIRILRKLTNISAIKCGETIGVDDFAYRKGQTYCTVICDGDTRKTIEVLERVFIALKRHKL